MQETMVGVLPFAKLPVRRLKGKIDIISKIPKEPNQAIISGLTTKNQLKCWEYWLELLQKEQSQGQNQNLTTVNSVETSSTAGGFNLIYNRHKITGQYCLEDIGGILTKNLVKSESQDARHCARIFVPIKNMDKTSFEKEIKRISQNTGYKIEYAYYSQNTQDEQGLIVLFGQNEEKRVIRKPLLTNEDLENYQQKIQNLELEIPKNNSNNRELKNQDFVEINSQNLTELQKIQLTFYWRKFFGPGYDLASVDKILNNPEILKTIITDQNGNIIAACTGETDNLGGIEITEFFAKSTFNNSKAGEYMLQLMITKCQQIYPNLKIYTEANMSSRMPFTAIKCGFIVPKMENYILQTEQIASANVKVDNFEENSYNNFVLLTYP